MKECGSDESRADRSKQPISQHALCRDQNRSVGTREPTSATFRSGAAWLLSSPALPRRRAERCISRRCSTVFGLLVLHSTVDPLSREGVLLPLLLRNPAESCSVPAGTLVPSLSTRLHYSDAPGVHWTGPQGGFLFHVPTHAWTGRSGQKSGPWNFLPWVKGGAARQDRSGSPGGDGGQEGGVQTHHDVIRMHLWF